MFLANWNPVNSEIHFIKVHKFNFLPKGIPHIKRGVNISKHTVLISTPSLKAINSCLDFLKR